MSRQNAGSGGIIERIIYVLTGLMLASGATAAAWYCYLLTIDTHLIPYRWLYVTASAGLAFFMYRGAWFAIFSDRSETKRFDLTSGGR